MFQLSRHIPDNLQTGFPITQAVLDGVQSGQVYNLNSNFFVVHKSGFCSLIQTEECRKELVKLFQQAEIPEYFHIYNAEEDLVNEIQEAADLFNFKIRSRVQLIYPLNRPVEVNHVEGFYCERITESNFESLSEFNLDLDNRFWNSRVDFLNAANGMIVCTKENHPVCICYAAAVAGDKAEIDVLTKENYRGKGLAKLVVANFVNYCLEKRVVPNWDCFEDNISSLNTARTLYFISQKKYRFISIFKKKSYEN